MSSTEELAQATISRAQPDVCQADKSAISSHFERSEVTNAMNGTPEKSEFDLFAEALRLPADQRLDYLKAACKGNSEVYEQVERLLKAHTDAGEFLEQGPTELKARTVSTGEKPGDRIGRYKLLEQIGEGGCGVVYMAEQEEPVRRRVALKIIKPGMDTRNFIARFEAERQALAMMDHPGIAQVFDAGATDTGRPYFVMELVRGLKITEHCDQKSLTTTERLDLFIQVCGAVQHAHQKGIIHRDLKPSNILVTTSDTGKALPKIIDFGIAKATTGLRLTDKTVFTAFEMLIGTPAYMSPEQAALTSVDVDTRSDIYSLGVLLYELLTGTTPFDTGELLKEGLDHVRRAICNQEPVRPSTRLNAMEAASLTTVSKRRQAEPPRLIREVRGDLDWIAMKALEKDRARRYPTANALAMDVQRYLGGEAILARPPKTLYKFQKLFSRNKLLFCGMAVLFTSLGSSLMVTLLLLAKERQALQQSDLLRMEAQANALDREGKTEEGLKMHREAVALRRKLFGTEQPLPWDSVWNLVMVLTGRGKFDEAESILNQALTPATLQNPACIEVVRLRGDFIFGHQGKWAEALADYQRALDFRPTEAQNYHGVAPLLVATTNVEAYRKLCPRIVEHFHDTTDPGTADQMAKDCLILPSSGVELRAVAAMADFAVNAGKGNVAYPFFQCCKALSEYRQGHWNEAVNWATNAAQNPFPYSRGEAWAILAMSDYRLGRTDDARAVVAQCAQLAKKQLPEFGHDLGNDWRDWIVVHALLKEAKELILGRGMPVNPSKLK